MKPYINFIISLTCILFVLFLTVSKAQESKPSVDVAIILATDVSGSIDASRYQLQIEGLASAFESAEIKRSIQLGYHKRIAVLYMQWSSLNQQWLSDWFIIETPEQADAFAQLIRETPRKFDTDTSVYGALHAAMRAYTNTPFEADKRVIDISGDGVDPNLTGIMSMRTIIKQMDIQINALPIVTPVEPNVGEWYIQNVIQGPGSFAIIIKDFNDFAMAIRRKLLTEIGERKNNERRVLFPR